MSRKKRRNKERNFTKVNTDTSQSEAIEMQEMEMATSQTAPEHNEEAETGLSLLEIAQRNHNEKKEVEEALAREKAQQERILNTVKGNISFNKEAQSYISIAKPIIAETVCPKEETPQVEASNHIMEETKILPTVPEQVAPETVDEQVVPETAVESTMEIPTVLETPSEVMEETMVIPTVSEPEEDMEATRRIDISEMQEASVLEKTEKETPAEDSLLAVAKQQTPVEEKKVEDRRIASTIVEEPVSAESALEPIGKAWFAANDGELTEKIESIECATTYEGRLKNGTAEIYWQNGAHESRYYVDNVLHGPMEHHYADGRILTGRYMENSITGQAVMIYPNGDREECHLVGGKREGLSVLHKKNGDRLESYWNNDIRDGMSTYYWASGTQQSIEFSLGVPSGRSIIRWKDGVKEERQYIDGMMQNHIIRYNSMGEAIEGHYEDDKFIVDRELIKNNI